MIITIEINNVDYKVCFVESGHHSLGPNRGVMNGLTKEIFIDKHLKDVEKTIIHELAHAIIEEYMIGDTDWTEERVADFTGKYYFMIRDLLDQILVAMTPNNKLNITL